MSENKIATRYAKSLLSIAKENSVLELVKDDIESILVAINQNRDLSNLLNSPIIKTEIKLTILKKILTGKCNATTEQFVLFVVKNSRESHLVAILNSFLVLYNTEKGLENATITSAMALSQSNTEAIIKQLETATKKKIILEKKIDRNLVGGFIIQIGDKLYDASLLNKFKNIRKELILN
jgi:F-type H+-transporting ATPase subunit delta